MTRNTLSAHLSALLLFAGVSGLLGQDGPKPDEIERMTAACPAVATAVPKAPRRILIMTSAPGFFHSSIPYASKAFEVMGAKSGAFETVVSDDPRMFAPDKLAAFDAVIMNNTTMRLPMVATDLDTRPEAERKALEAEEESLKKGLVDFVRSGKGLIGVHAATDCFYTWPEYGEMIGGYFWGHPWNEDVAVKLDDPGHPLLRAFKGRGFVVADEIYQFKEPYSRDVLRVLLSLDVQGTNMDKGDAIQRKDGDFAVAWIHEVGRGRVFFFSLGHRHEIFWNPPILQAYLDGIQYALGDLPADATPSSKLSKGYLRRSAETGRAAGLDAMFTGILTYRLGVDDNDAKRIADLVVESQAKGKESSRADLDVRLAAALAQPQATSDCRRFACRQLALIGTPKAIPAPTPFLADPEIGHVARYALQQIPGKAAEKALLAALPVTNGRNHVGIIDALGTRRVDAAVEPLSKLLTDPDPTTAAAAAFALGQIASPAAAKALLAATGTGACTRAQAEALVAAGDLLDAEQALFTGMGNQRVAKACFERVYASAQPAHLRAAAFRGLVLQRGSAALPDVIEALRGDQPEFVRAAALLAQSLPGRDVSSRLAGVLPDLPAGAQALVIDSLAVRADRAALPAIVKVLASPDETVSLAALRALETLGDWSSVMLLADAAADAGDRDQFRDTARRSLDRLRADAVDTTLETGLAGSSPPVQCELIRALGARHASFAVPTLLKMAENEDREVRKQSLESLALLAQPDDLPDLVALLCSTSTSSSRGKLETIIVSVARRAIEPKAGPTAVLAALSSEISTEARCSLLEALGRMAHSDGLPALYAALEAGDESVNKAAVKALADWPDATPMDTLRTVSLSSPSDVLRVLALRGYARQLSLPSSRPMRDTLGRYREAFNLAKGEQEKRSLLAGLGGVVHPDALALAKEYLDVEGLQEDALLAAVTIMKGLDGAAMKVSASASGGNDKPEQAIDSTRKTRWTSGRKQEGDEWFEIDLGYETDIHEIRLDAGDTGGDWPIAYTIYVSTNRETWGDPVLTGEGKEKIMTLALSKAYGRYIRIEQKGVSGGNYWSIADLKVNGFPETLDEASMVLDRTTWVVSASKQNGDAGNAIDGDLTKRWGTGGGQRPGDWYQVDLGEAKTIRRIILDAAQSTSDYPRGYKIMVSDDGEAWRGPIGMGTPEAQAKTVIPVLPTTARFVRIVETGDGDNWWWSIYDLQILAD